MRRRGQLIDQQSQLPKLIHGVGGDLSSALVVLAGGRFRDQDHLLSVFVAHSSEARKPSQPYEGKEAASQGQQQRSPFVQGVLESTQTSTLSYMLFQGQVGDHAVVQVAYHVGQGAYLLVTGPIDFSAPGRPVPAHQVEQEWLVGCRGGGEHSTTPGTFFVLGSSNEK